MVLGAAIIKDPDVWTFFDWANWDQNNWSSGSAPRDIFISLNRKTQLPGVTAFDFAYQLRDSGAGVNADWYPDSANSPTGDFFRYTIGDLSVAPAGSSSDLYHNTVTNDRPLVYYRLNETTSLVASAATNSGSLGDAGNGVYTLGVAHQVAGAIVGDSDTAAKFSALNPNSDNGGVPVIVPYNAAFNPAGSFTVEAWLRPTINGNGNAQAPLFNRDASDALPNRVGWDFFQRDSSVGWNFRMFNGNGTARVFNITGGPYTVGQWQHLVAVYDAAIPSATLYLNGVQVAQSTTPNGSFAPNTSFPLAIGSYGDAMQNPFVGDMDEVAIYATALSSAQVLAHYQNGLNASRSIPYSTLVATDGAVEYLRFNETAKNVATNSGTLGSSVNGVYNLNVINGVQGPQATNAAGFEASNTAATFNGGTSYIELGNPAALNFVGQITLEAWVQPSLTPAAPGSFGSIIAHGYDSEISEFALRVDNTSGTPQYVVTTYTPGLGKGASAPVPAADLGTGAWVHLVATFDGQNWNLYRNGVLIASQPDTTGSILVNYGNWAIGARGRWEDMDVLNSGLDRQFQGKIDEVAIYDRALSSDAVKAHYFAGAFNMPTIKIARVGSDVILTWLGGTLQQADSVTGSYTDVVGAQSPYAIPANAASKFFRVKM
ncbi:MAG: LamG domain-containing protein [Verrucomicrobiota bacterium]